MEQQHGIDPANKEEVQTAKRYLHRYRKFMNYAEYRSHGSPIGSGIVESACKQIVTERLKLSWHALETRRSPTDPDSAVDSPEPNMGCHVEERISSTASRQRPKLSTSPVISLPSVRASADRTPDAGWKDWKELTQDVRLE